MIVVGDTSGLVAAFNIDDPEHAAARRAFAKASATVISPLVFGEIEHIITRNDAVLTLDRRDFRAVRPLSSHTAFRVLPDAL